MEKNVKKPQLRGQKLLDMIELCLRELAHENNNYVYNASELSRRVGCSRPTLDSKSEFIDNVLNKLGAEKRLKKDHPVLEHFHIRIERLENEKKALEKELDALRVNHARVYSTLYMASVDASVLIKPIVEGESVIRGKCILCDQTVNENHKFHSGSSVTHLTGLKKDKF